MMVVIAMAVMSVGFASCGGDDDDEPGGGDNSELVAKLQGEWEFTKGTESFMGYTFTMGKSDLDEMKSMMSMTQGIKIEIWDETLKFSGTKVNGVPYYLKGNQLILDGMDLFEGFTINIKSISSSTLVLHEDINMEGVSIIADLEYRKK